MDAVKEDMQIVGRSRRYKKQAEIENDDLLWQPVKRDKRNGIENGLNSCFYCFNLLLKLTGCGPDICDCAGPGKEPIQHSCHHLLCLCEKKTLAEGRLVEMEQES